jgi:hypothetical protein
MNQDSKDIDAKRESAASKRLVKLIKPESRTRSNYKINKRQTSILVILMIFVVVVVTFIYIYSVNKSDMSFNQKINELTNLPPPAYSSGKQDEWASAQIDSLRNSKLSESSNEDALAAYYNKLFTYYSMSNRTQEAKDVYVNEVKSKSVMLQVAILEWLLSTLSSEDSQLKNMLIEDILVSLNQQLNGVEDADKPEIKTKIDYYSKAKQVVQ